MKSPPPLLSNRPRGHIFRRYVVAFVAVVSAVLLASTVVGMYFGYQESRQAIFLIQQEKVQLAAHRIRQFARDIEGQLLWTAQARWAASKAGLEQRRLEFLELQKRVPPITQLAQLDQAGRERLRVSRVDIDVVGSLSDLSRDPKFVAARTGDTYFSPIYFLQDSEPYMSIAIAGRDPERGLTVTVAEVNLKFIWDVVSQIRIGRAGYVYVVDGQGNLIAHPDIALVLKRTSLIELPHVKRALQESSGQRIDPESGTGIGLSSRRALTSHARMSSLPALPKWIVFAEQPLSEAFEPLYATIYRTLGILAVGLALAVVASLVLAQRMVRPIHALQSGAARIASGELDHRVDVRTGDELEALAEEFNDMARALQDERAGLEQKVAERTRELAVANRQLDEASRHKSQFLANMSHELRTPLNAILGYTELVMDGIYGEVPEKIRDVLGRLEKSGRHLLGLINDVLDLSKIEAGQLTLTLSEYSMKEVVQTVQTAVESLADEKGLALLVSIAPDLPAGRGDERRISQVLLNLVGNAIKFTDAGEIQITVGSEDGQFLVSVADTGPGIAQADQDRIFEEFQQASGNRQQKAGTGLGLAISRRIIELHGGRIWVESSPGRGATFRFTLPFNISGARQV